MHLDAQQPDALQTYLLRQGWISENELITRLEKPGEGNMNYALRVTLAIRSDDDNAPGGPATRTLIVKQARPFVEKYPSIAAPVERAVVEGRFYAAIATNPMLQRAMPQLLGVDEAVSLLVLEDLGVASDFTYLYQPGQTMSTADAQTLARYLATLHGQFAGCGLPDPAFINRAMRTLNHAHVFHLPFQPDNGFDLDAVQPGLQALATPYQQNAALRASARQLGDVYVADATTAGSTTLLHGDFYPGSWLRAAGGVRVIDPEFCFYGPAEFDLGVMLAHTYLSSQADALRQTIREVYEPPTPLNEPLLRRFVGVEIMRRLIGLAQLPLALSIDEKKALLAQAADMLTT